MKATLFISLGLGFLAACGSSGGSKNPDAPGGTTDGPGGTVDAPGMLVDAPGMMADAPPAPAMITISGTATARSTGGATPVSGATIAAYKTSNETTPVATTTTDAQGNFSLTISTGGIALDGYLKATANTYVDTYLYPPAPLTADFSMAAVNMLTSNTYSFLQLLCGANQTAQQGTIAAEVVDATGTVVQGATVSSNPAAGTYCYDGANGLPDKMATGTGADGVGFMFSVSGNEAVTAAKTGATFKTHTVTARAGAFTTTIITE